MTTSTKDNAMADLDAVRWALVLRADVKVYETKNEVCRIMYDHGESDPMSDAWKAADLERSHAASNIHRHFNHDKLLAICEWIISKA